MKGKVKKVFAALGIFLSLGLFQYNDLKSATYLIRSSSGSSSSSSTVETITLLDEKIPGSYKVRINLPDSEGVMEIEVGGGKGANCFEYNKEGGAGGVTIFRIPLSRIRSMFGNTLDLYYVVGGAGESIRDRGPYQGGSASGAFVNGFPWLHTGAIPLAVGGGGGSGGWRNKGGKGGGGNNKGNGLYSGGYGLGAPLWGLGDDDEWEEGDLLSMWYHGGKGDNGWALNGGCGRNDAIGAGRGGCLYGRIGSGGGWGAGSSVERYGGGGGGYCNTSLGTCYDGGANNGTGYVKVIIRKGAPFSIRLN